MKTLFYEEMTAEDHMLHLVENNGVCLRHGSFCNPNYCTIKLHNPGINCTKINKRLFAENWLSERGKLITTGRRSHIPDQADRQRDNSLRIRYEEQSRKLLQSDGLCCTTGSDRCEKCVVTFMTGRIVNCTQNVALGSAKEFLRKYACQPGENEGACVDLWEDL
jgi:hypothetical protein